MDITPDERSLVLYSIEETIRKEKNIDKIRSLIKLLDKMYGQFVEADEVESKNVNNKTK